MCCVETQWHNCLADSWPPISHTLQAPSEISRSGRGRDWDSFLGKQSRCRSQMAVLTGSCRDWTCEDWICSALDRVRAHGVGCRRHRSGEWRCDVQAVKFDTQGVVLGSSAKGGTGHYRCVEPSDSWACEIVSGFSAGGGNRVVWGVQWNKRHVNSCRPTTSSSWSKWSMYTCVWMEELSCTVSPQIPQSRKLWMSWRTDTDIRLLMASNPFFSARRIWQLVWEHWEDWGISLSLNQCSKLWFVWTVPKFLVKS